MKFLQIVYWYMGNDFTKKNRLHHSLDAQPKTLAGLHYGGPREVGHHVRDLGHQRGSSVVRGFVNIPLTNAAAVPKATVGTQAAWACRMGMSMPHAARACRMGMSMPHAA